MRAEDPAPARVVSICFREEAEPEVSVLICVTGRSPHLLGCLEALAKNVRDVSFEVILVLNAADESVERALNDWVRGVKVVRSRVNRGFSGGCNHAARHARGRYLALLNDDAEVASGWLEYLKEALEARPERGAVGSRILHADGSLQEAASILWSDGSTTCVGRDLAADAPQSYNYARRVAFCSMCAMLVRREVWDALSGVDESFFPAYCEDLDFCLRAAEKGWTTWYEPRALVLHHESKSSSEWYKVFLIERNRHLIRERWGTVLADCELLDPENMEVVARAVWRAMGEPVRVLVVDDCIPKSALGSGFARMLDTITEIAEDGGYHVALAPTDTTAGDASQLIGLGVEVIYEPLAEHLQRAGVHYDVAIVSRPHNFEYKAPLIRAMQPGCHIIYDAEAVFHRRLDKQVVVAASALERALLRREARRMQEVEAEIARNVDHIVALSEEEAALFEKIPVAAGVTVIEPLLRGIAPTSRPVHERSNMVMVAGWLAGGASSPNGDGLIWFVQQVLPQIAAKIPWARLRVTGANPPADIRRLESPSVVFEGNVADLGDLYDQARVVIVPLRFGAGVKNKTMEALQYAVPTVATPTGAEGLDLAETDALEITDDPTEFADRVLRLLEDPEAWAIRRASIETLLERWSARPERLSWPAVLRSVSKRTISRMCPPKGAQMQKRGLRSVHGAAKLDDQSPLPVLVSAPDVGDAQDFVRDHQIQDHVAELERRLEERALEALVLDAEVHYLQSDLAVRSEFIQTLEAELAQAAQVQVLETELAAQSAALGQLQASVAEREAELVAAGDERARLKAEVTAYRERISTVAVDRLATSIRRRPLLRKLAWEARTSRTG